jgi:hypothetical protein
LPSIAGIIEALAGEHQAGSIEQSEADILPIG